MYCRSAWRSAGPGAPGRYRSLGATTSTQETALPTYLGILDCVLAGPCVQPTFDTLLLGCSATSERRVGRYLGTCLKTRIEKERYARGRTQS